jgi:hypothetical protein
MFLFENLLEEINQLTSSDPDRDPPLIIPSSITIAEKGSIQGHSHIAARRHATRRARRAQDFPGGDLVLVLVAALN